MNYPVKISAANDSFDVWEYRNARIEVRFSLPTDRYYLRVFVDERKLKEDDQDVFELDYQDALTKRILATAMAKVDFALNESDATIEDVALLSKIAIEVAIAASKTNGSRFDHDDFHAGFNAIDAAKNDGFMNVCLETARAIMAIVGQK